MHADYQIGIFHRLDRDRFQREWRPWFHGVEVSNLVDQTEADQVLAFLREGKLPFGIHFPLLQPAAGSALHPLVCSLDPEQRAAAVQQVAAAMQSASRQGAEYLLIHFPKPAILDSRLDWSDWRFAQSDEAIIDSLIDREEAAAAAADACRQLAGLPTALGLPLVLELDILHAWHYRELLVELFQRYPQLGLCLDTGRLHLLRATDRELEPIQLIRSLRSQITNLHLWTVRTGENRRGGHHPVLPSQSGADGWGEIGLMLAELSAAERATVLFEHRSDLVSSVELEECYQWVRDTLEHR